MSCIPRVTGRVYKNHKEKDKMFKISLSGKVKKGMGEMGLSARPSDNEEFERLVKRLIKDNKKWKELAGSSLASNGDGK